jgi:hypothetical protein
MEFMTSLDVHIILLQQNLLSSSLARGFLILTKLTSNDLQSPIAKLHLVVFFCFVAKCAIKFKEQKIKQQQNASARRGEASVEEEGKNRNGKSLNLPALHHHRRCYCCCKIQKRVSHSRFSPFRMTD